MAVAKGCVPLHASGEADSDAAQECQGLLAVLSF